MKDDCNKINKNIIQGSVPHYIKIKVNDSRTGKLMFLVVDNGELADYLALKRGLKTDRYGRFSDVAVYDDFLQHDYILSIKQNEKWPLAIDLEDFAKTLIAHTGVRDSTQDYLRRRVVHRPLAFADLQVDSRQEFIDRYLVVDTTGKPIGIKQQFYKKYNSDPAFIALLIDMGFTVGRGDVVQLLWIQERESR